MSKSVVILIVVLTTLTTVSWTIKINRKVNSSKFPYTLGLLGFDYDPNFKHEEYTDEDRKYSLYDGDLPLQYDARLRKTKHFKICSHQIKNVMDQGKCAASWAFAPLGVVSILVCMWSLGQFNNSLSPEDLISCCHFCGRGCGGGYLDDALLYLKKKGVVTGSDYNSGSGCKPFSEGAFKYGITQRCKRTCRKGYSRAYDEDLYVTVSPRMLKSNVEAIQRMVYFLPKVIVNFAVYDDFANYRGGVYSRGKNAVLVGSHVVRLIGFGIENGVPYWLAVNSWGTKWGMGGFFKIKRGTNECGIEQQPIEILVSKGNYQTTKEITTTTPDPDFPTRKMYFTDDEVDDSDKGFSSAQTDTINYRLVLGLMSFYFIFDIL